MGFQKTEEVEAVGVDQAITFAGDALVRRVNKLGHRPYNRCEFDVVELRRGHAVPEAA